MKPKIHPQYFEESKVKCACGNEFTVGATQKEIDTEICSKCHPFYTGTDRGAVSGGRIEKFQQKLEKKTTYKTRTQKRAEKKAKKEDK